MGMQNRVAVGTQDWAGMGTQNGVAMGTWDRAATETQDSNGDTGPGGDGDMVLGRSSQEAVMFCQRFPSSIQHLFPICHRLLSPQACPAPG